MATMQSNAASGSVERGGWEPFFPRGIIAVAPVTNHSVVFPLPVCNLVRGSPLTEKMQINDFK